MEGYARIGTLYLLREPKDDKNLVWSVIENNSNDETSTLVVVEECSKKGKKAKVNAKWLYEREPIGPILPPSDEIVIENGIEFVKSNGIERPHEEEKNNSVNLSFIDSPIISENEEPVYNSAFTKTKTPRDGFLVKSRSIYGRKKWFFDIINKLCYY